MAKIKSKIDEITGKDAQEAKFKEQYNFLQRMAEAKCAEFKSELRDQYTGKTGDLEVVGRKAIQFYSGQHIDVHEGASESITNAMKDFFKGKSGVKSGFLEILTGTINTLCGDLTVGETKKDYFFIVPEQNSIVRYDVKVYVYNFSSKDVFANVSNVFCYTLAKSIVDHDTLNKDELIYFVSDTIRDENGNMLLSNVKEYLTEIIDIWNLLDNINRPESDKPKMLKSSKPNKLILEDFEV